MQNSNFALILIDSLGVEQAVTSSGDLTPLNGNILFNTKENAEKGLKKILLRLQREGMSRARYWVDEVNSNPGRFVNPGEADRLLKQYEDYKLMENGNIQIKEVLLTTI